MKNILFILCCLLFCCQSEQGLSNDLQKEIDGLTDKRSQRAFLEKIATSDQYVREQETIIQQQHGYDSKEHKQAIQMMMKTDENNLKKVEAYLAKFGYPNKLDHGNKAVYGPWMVIHHSPSETPRRRNFKYLYQAYLKEDLAGDRLAFFLGRMYNREFGERIRWEGPFTVQQELDSMINALDLRRIVNEIKLK